MAVVDTDIKVYCSLNMPESNGTTSGGGIDLATKAVFTDIAATDSVKIVSDNAADTTQVVTITGRDASGAIISSIINLNGTTLSAASSNTFERILKIVIDSSHAGTVTVSRNTGGATIATLETGILSARRLFYDAAADVGGGADRIYYEKIFIKNTNGVSAVSSASVQENSDPSTYVTFDLEGSKDGTNSVVDRLDTAPTGMLGTFTNSNKSIPGGSLGPGQAIGTWLALNLLAGTSPAKNTWGVRLSGTTT